MFALTIPAVMMAGAMFATDRERDVLVLIAGGLSNADIGNRMHLSVGTIKDHVSALLTKVKVGSRVQAQQPGLLRQPPNGEGRHTPASST